jgi:ElaB/YqjD/DUF883 family membrane-anchored ribosome-binding protein
MRGESRPGQQEVRGRATEDLAGRETERTVRDTPDDTARIRTEIARTREDMSETIDEIQDRLSPRNLMSHARETVKEKTVGRVKQAARNVGQSASELAEQTRDVAAGAAENVRHNPWPALLIGGGTAWLLIDGARRQRGKQARGRDSVEYDLDEMTDYDESSAPRRAYGYDTGRYETGRFAETGVRRTTTQFQQLLQRNPLAVGAVAAAVGVAVGLALPETERENRLMGDARDTLVEKAQGAAQGAVEKAKQVAGDAAKEVAGEAVKQVTEPRRR